jgi:hypothetical protein
MSEKITEGGRIRRRINAIQANNPNNGKTSINAAGSSRYHGAGSIS